MKLVHITWLFILLNLSTIYSCVGQRFSFLLEGGAMRTQIDGDKLDGFHKNGYNLGFGTNFLLDNSNFIVIKTSYYNQGSVNELDVTDNLRSGLRLAFAFNSAGVELSYKYKPREGPTFVGFGFVHHRILNYAHEASFRSLTEDFVELQPDLIRPSFTSLKGYYGIEFLEGAGFYLAFEGSFDSFLRESYYNINAMRPYALSANIFVDLISNKKIDAKKRRTRRRR